MAQVAPPPTHPDHANREAVGRLCVGGDWACAHGNFGGLAAVAHHLIALAPLPIQRRLAELEAACRGDPARAGALWNELRGPLASDELGGPR